MKNNNDMNLKRILASLIEDKDNQEMLSEGQYTQQLDEGKKLKKLRKKLKISYEEISDKMKISPTLIRKLEAGDYVDGRKGIYLSSLFAMKFILVERQNALRDFMDSMDAD